MTNRSEPEGPDKGVELRDLIDSKVSEIVEVAATGGWNRDEALLAIEDCLAFRWPKKSDPPIHLM